MIWNVYRNNFNTKKIEVFNIFDHISFLESVKKILKQTQNKKEFSENIRKELLYYFWSKYEYEVIITSFPVYINQKELNKINSDNNSNSNNKTKISIEPDVGIKVDIYSQVMNNFDIFVDYIWNNKQEFLNN